MKSLRVLATAAALLPSLAFAAAGPSADKMMGAMFDGPPVLASTKLHQTAYVNTSVKKLAHAQIAYVNWEAIGEILREMGFKNPPKQLTSELTAAILNKAGYAMPMPGEPEETYLSEFRDLYSIRYGGKWINYNHGSGRNGAGGVVDTKGIGKTILVRSWADGGHGSGTMHLTEAIHEAIWSNVLHQELPFGANRVLFILTTGTNIDGNAPGAQPRALLVREDPNRPAYFQQNDGVHSDLMPAQLRAWHQAGDAARMENVLPKLIDSLPMPSTLRKNATAPEKLRAGFLEFVDRTAYVYATGYARQIMLSGVSTSNTQIDGTALDFGATTAVVGFPMAKAPIGESAHGTTDTLKSDLILEWANDLRDVLPADLVKAVPSNEELAKRLDQQFAKRVLQGMLELAGAPKDLSLDAINTPEGRAFAKTILKIAQAGNETEVVANFGDMPTRRTGTYHLENILNALITGDSKNLKSELINFDLRVELLTTFTAYKTEMKHIAEKRGVDETALQAYAERAVAARNRTLRDLVWDQTKSARSQTVSDVYVATVKAGAASANVQSFIDTSIEKNVREFKSKPFTLQTAAPGVRVTFDLRSGIETTKPLVQPQALRMCRDLFR